METPFKDAEVGDEVYSMLYGKGKILNTSHLFSYPLLIEFFHGRKSYNLKGYNDNNHHQPTLFWSKPEIKAPEKAKRLVTKTITKYINIYPTPHSTGGYYNSMEVAKRAACGPIIATIPVTGEYLVEE